MTLAARLRELPRRLGAVRPTRDGAGLAIGSIALYLAGVVLGYAALNALAVGGAALLVAALAIVVVRPRLALRRVLVTDRVTVGDIAQLQLNVRNLSALPAPTFTATDHIGSAPVRIHVRSLTRRGHRRIDYSIRTTRRGRIPIGPLTVDRSDPLRLLRHVQVQISDDVLWVHPVTHPIRTLPVGVVLDYEGRTSDNAPRGALTFSSLREYVPGDDPRRIHWRSSARLGTIIVREHVDTTEPTTTVVLDTRHHAYADDAFEPAVEAAASIAHGTELTRLPVTLHIGGEVDRSWSALTMLDRLAAAELTVGTEPVALLEVVERAVPGGALVVVTGTHEPGMLARLAEQRRRFNPVVVIAVREGGGSAIRRRPGMAVLTAQSGAEAAELWNRLVAGETG